MPQRDDDNIPDVPKITPDRDEIDSYQRNQSKGRVTNSLGEVPEQPASRSGGSSGFMKTVLTLVTLALIATAALAAYLYQKMIVAEAAIDNYELRIADLEQRLEVTDESMSESSLAMKVKVRELDSEIRKLWDNVWKRTKEDLAKLDKASKAQAGQLKTLQSSAGETQKQFDAQKGVIDELSKQLEAVSTLRETVATNSQQVRAQSTSQEAAIDKLNLMNKELNAMTKRVKETEEWIDSINGFRRQVNRDISELKQSGSAAPATAP